MFDFGYHAWDLAVLLLIGALFLIVPYSLMLLFELLYDWAGLD